MRTATEKPSYTVTIESTDYEGQGIARVEGKAVFVEGGLPGERAVVRVTKQKSSYDKAVIETLIAGSSQRVMPRCPHFGVCGGCSGQHHEWRAQIAVKQRVLEDALTRIGKVTPERILPPLMGLPWHYRHRARLSVRHVEKKGGVLVGFHEKQSSYVADMKECHVLPVHVSALLLPLRDLVAALSIRDRMPQVEVAVGDTTTVLVFRILEALSDADEALLRSFGDQHNVHIWLQTAGPDTAAPFYPPRWDLHYGLREFDVKLKFSPTEFTQVNPHINAVLVRSALRLLNPQPGERIADLFCGLGNFTLPIARSGAHVVGVEGHAGLVRRAEEGAKDNGLTDRATFFQADLFKSATESLHRIGPVDGILIDPPREGAMEIVKALSSVGETVSPSRVVYVSCSPSTLARDAAVLVNEKGYVLRAAGIANMFPHTAHVESIALFEVPRATDHISPKAA